MLATQEAIQEPAFPRRLGELLPRWLREVPLYRKRGITPLLAGGAVTPEALRRLPLITKQDIRTGFPENFLRSGVELDSLLANDLVELEQTSGTSEAPTPLLLGRGWWAEQEERALRLNQIVAGVLDEFPAARRVTISSPLCSADISYRGTPSRCDRIVGNALFVSLSRFPLLSSEAELARMAAEAVEWDPVFLDVDPVYGVAFALYCERHGIRLPSLRFILGSYEFVSVTHRRILERVFGVPLFNLYGSTETGHLLMEDERGEMRPSYETACLELLDTDTTGVGELVVTTVTNDYMPLIRYRIGDLTERRIQPYGTHYVVHGRAAEAFVAGDGRRVTTWQIDELFREMNGVAHYQLQEKKGHQFLLRIVADATPPSDVAITQLRRRLEKLLGLAEGVMIQQADFLMPESSGKFRLGYPAKLLLPTSTVIS
jgi:phenylacetate-CoA ligase